MEKPAFFNEMYDGEALRPAYAHIVELFSKYAPDELALKKAEAETIFRRLGITFAVYGEENNAERLIPFDMMPRVFLESEWRRLERGVKQRARALNAFLWDVYHRGEIIRSGRIPAELVYQNAAYEPSVVGITPARKIYSHIIGIDLVRTGLGEFYVLEDNCRTPSGVSYMLENRQMRGRALRGDPYAGGVQFRLLRAFLSGRPDGAGTGGRFGFIRRWRILLYAHHARPQAGGCDLSAD